MKKSANKSPAGPFGPTAAAINSLLPKSASNDDYVPPSKRLFSTSAVKHNSSKRNSSESASSYKLDTFFKSAENDVRPATEDDISSVKSSEKSSLEISLGGLTNNASVDNQFKSPLAMSSARLNCKATSDDEVVCLETFAKSSSPAAINRAIITKATKSKNLDCKQSTISLQGSLESSQKPLTSKPKIVKSQ